MLRDLLQKRNDEYKLITDQILALYQNKLIKALRFYMKTDKNIHITYLDFYYNNNNFIKLKFNSEFTVGDRIIATDGKTYNITTENISNFISEQLDLYLPLKVIETSNPVQICEKIIYYDNFIKNHGAEKFVLCINSGIEDFDDLTSKPQYAKLLESLTDPIRDIVNNFDDLQKTQYMLFCKSKKKVIN